MRIPSTPRRTGARNKPVHFSYVSTERGQPWEAYIAGPAWWGPVHMTRPSKPCVYEVTGGAVPCRFCADGARRVAQVKGWLPLYRRLDALACMIPVDEAQRDLVDDFKLFAKVQVGRSKGKGSGVWVQPCLSDEPKWVSSLPERQVAADVTESLLVVWSVPELSLWFARSDTAVSLPKEKPAPVKDDVRTSGVDAAWDRITSRVAPSTNGKH